MTKPRATFSGNRVHFEIDLLINEASQLLEILQPLLEDLQSFKTVAEKERERKEAKTQRHEKKAARLRRKFDFIGSRANSRIRRKLSVLNHPATPNDRVRIEKAVAEELGVNRPTLLLHLTGHRKRLKTRVHRHRVHITGQLQKDGATNAQIVARLNLTVGGIQPYLRKAKEVFQGGDHA